MSATLLTFGAFDTPHAGHAAFLRRCEEIAGVMGRVIVGVRSDEIVRENKGALPVFSYAERSALIEALGYEVRESSGPGRELIEEIAPDVLAIGSDWRQADWLSRLGVDQATLDARGIVTAFVPYTRGISTTELKRRLCG